MTANRSLPAELSKVPALQAPIVFANDYDGVQGVTGVCPPEDDPTRAVGGAMGLLLKVAMRAEFGLHRGGIVQEWREAEKVGSFAPTDMLRRQLGEAAFERFMEEYGRNEDEFPLLYPETLDYHRRLTGSDAQLPAANFSLTWGLEEWQVPKLAASGVPGHVEITAIKNKGIYLESMRNDETKRFDLVATDESGTARALISAQTVTLVDDKDSSFDALPADCSGILVKRPGEKRKLSQQGGTTHPDIQEVPDLDAIHITDAMRIDPRQPAAREALQGDIRFMPLASYLLRAA